MTPAQPRLGSTYRDDHPGRLIVDTANESLTAYRIVKGIHRSDPVMLDVFRSNYERDARPRGLEVESAVIHFGLSMYLERDMATATARRWPRLGRHLAVVQLPPGNGFCWAHTAQPGHVTVWGRPLQLLACIADILPVGD
jgi:hypothetical protein